MKRQREIKALVLVASLFLLFSCTRTAKPAAVQAQPAAEIEAREEAPPGPGKVGPAVTLTGDVARGALVFGASCADCHGKGGEGKVLNPGSTDGTVPPLNPIDPAVASANHKTFVDNIDIYIEHGSKPEGLSPRFSMPAFGEAQKLKPQQIADVIAYTISIGRR
jgi:mono/diheme cytochrome c family protein